MNPSTSAIDSSTSAFWGSYALGLLHDVRVGPEIVEYSTRIEDTLRPFGGAFLVHGAPWQIEGEPIGEPVLIGFPAADGAQQWYQSPPYQALAQLRTANSTSRVFLIHGVDATHRSDEIVDRLTADVG